MALNHHPNLTLHHLHTTTNDASSSSSSSCRSFPLQDDQGISYAHPFIESKPSLYPHEVARDVALGRKKEINDLKLTILKSYNQDHHNGTSSSPTALKMRFLQKSMTSNYYDQTIDYQNSKRVDYSPTRESNGENSINNNNESCGLIRACSDCGTTRTPLWRSGPHGPKSLCNACGIRQRKARRAAMALAASDDTTCASNTTNNNTTSKLNLFKEMSAPKNIIKKRSKNNNHARKTTTHQTTTTKKKISFQEFALNLSKKLSLHHFFQQDDDDDEKEAAILLMALSSGFRS